MIDCVLVLAFNIEAQTPEHDASATGRGDYLESLPFDILVELAPYLRLADLLALSRTSRTLRDTLKLEDSAVVWRTARQAEGIPDTPEDISEREYAVILFGETCFVSPIFTSYLFISSS